MFFLYIVIPGCSSFLRKQESRIQCIVIPAELVPAKTGSRNPESNVSSFLLPEESGIHCLASPGLVIPAEAGIQQYLNENLLFTWIPACAGMTYRAQE